MPLPAEKYLRVHPSDPNLNKFCEEWLLRLQSGGATSEQDAKMLNLVQQHPDTALMCAVTLVELAGTDVKDAALAGPFELILAKRGAEYVDVVCELSKSLSRLPKILGYIWGDHLPKAVMRKIELFRENAEKQGQAL